MSIAFRNKFNWNWLKGRNHLSKDQRIALLVEEVSKLIDRVEDLERRLES